MRPDDDILKKRLHEKFADYEPEPATSWQQIEGKLPARPAPLNRWRLPVMAGIICLLLIGLVSYWVRWWPDSSLANQARVTHAGAAKSTRSSPRPLPTIDEHIPVTKSGKARQASQTIPVPNHKLTSEMAALSEKAVSDVNPVPVLSSFSNKKRLKLTLATKLVETVHRQLSARLVKNRASIPRPLVGSSVAAPTDAATQPSVSLPEPTPIPLEGTISSAQKLSNRLIISINPLVIHSYIPARTQWAIQQPTVASGLKPALTVRPRQTDLPVWVVKGGPLLGYRFMQAQVRENTSARNIQNPNPSAAERLGWHVYAGQQRPLSNGRQWEIGAVYRRFNQGIQYQLPTGQYIVQIETNQSATVTQLRDTLTDQPVAQQLGLRMGYRAPLFARQTSRLYWGIGGEVVHQFNLNRAILNAELTVGTTISARQHGLPIGVELFGNTALQSVEDKQGWVKVLPYHIGLRIGVPLMPVR